MAERISIFDIPLICDLISQSMARRDVASCALVSRAWFARFRRQVWSQIDDGPAPSKLAPSFREYQCILLNNARYIRRLTLHSDKVADILLEEGSECVHLTEIVRLPEEPDKILGLNLGGEEAVGADRHVNVGTMFALVAQNPKLLYLKVSIRHARFPVANGHIDVLSKHQSLRYLDLGFNNVRAADFRVLLQNLPPHLQTLRIDWHILGYDDRDEYPQMNWPSSSSPLYQRLCEVHILRPIFARDSKMSLFALLRRCPNLIEMTVPRIGTDSDLYGELGTVLATFCPKLESLDLNSGCCNMERFMALVTPLGQAPIKAFKFCNSVITDPNEQLYRTLAVCWARSLETLEFSDRFSLKSSAIQRFLDTCIGLKTLILPQESGLNLEEISSSGWVCFRLERLTLTVLDGPLGPKRTKERLNRWIQGDDQDDNRSIISSTSSIESFSSCSSSSASSSAVVDESLEGFLDDATRARVLRALGQLLTLPKLKDLCLRWGLTHPLYSVQNEDADWKFEYKLSTSHGEELWPSLVRWVETL
ncbi:hypothetical protein BGX28_007420 [Mortierella sp. GBA30]|nr:hypothetical protein BGX28_007420 [Mortierella sp. GBA30]